MEDGFKKLPKMQCFREGGSVKTKAMCSGGKTYKKGGHAESKEMKKDVKQDKAIIKKAFKMHDEQEHKGEKTDLSKLRKGGRMKKSVGTVKKYKIGGFVTGGSDVAKDGGKKTGGADIKTGKKTGGSDAAKDGGKRTGGSDAAKDGGVTRGLNNPMKKGGAAKKSVKKYANGGAIKKFSDGSSTGELTAEEKAWLGGADATDPIIMARMRSALGPRKAAPAVTKPVDTTLRDETGMVSSLQRNPETGELYTPVSQMTPSAPVKAAAKPVARPVAPAKPVDSTLRDETGAVASLQRNPETGELYSTSRTAAAPSAAVASRKSPTTLGDFRSSLNPFSGFSFKDKFARLGRKPVVAAAPVSEPAVYKKGGKVKKMADGKLSGPVSDTEKARLANRAQNRELLGPAQKRELDAQEAAAAKSAPVSRRKGGKACA